MKRPKSRLPNAEAQPGVAVENPSYRDEHLLSTPVIESFGILAAGVAHDLGNLLSSILAETDLALTAAGDSGPFQELQRIRVKVVHAFDVVSQLASYARRDTPDLELVNVSKLAEDTVELLGASVSKRAVLKASFGHGLPAVLGRPSQIRQVLLNLVLNASEALRQETGVIEIATSRIARTKDLPAGGARELPEGEWVCLEVSDTGCGMTKAQMSRIFEPDFTTKRPGHGVGLALVRSAVRAHGGTIRVASSVRRGSTFQIFLPSARRARAVIQDPHGGTESQVPLSQTVRGAGAG